MTWQSISFKRLVSGLGIKQASVGLKMVNLLLQEPMPALYKTALESGKSTNVHVRQQYSLTRQLGLLKEINQRMLVETINAIGSCRASASYQTMECGLAFGVMCDRLSVATTFPHEYKAARSVIANAALAKIAICQNQGQRVEQIWKENIVVLKQVLPVAAMTDIAQAGQDLAHTKASAVAMVLQSGAVGHKLLSYAAKACLENTLSSALRNAVDQVFSHEYVCADDLQKALASVSSSLNGSVAFARKHTCFLEFYKVPLSLNVACFEAEWDLMTGGHLKQCSHGRGLHEFAWMKSLGFKWTAVHLAGHALTEIDPTIIADLNMVRTDIDLTVQHLPEDVQGEDILQHIAVKVPEWRIRDKSS